MANKKQLTPALAQIELLTADYAAARTDLFTVVGRIKAATRTVTERLLPSLRDAAGRTRDTRAALEAALQAHKAEFEKPRTRIFHGVKVGWRKLIGSLKWVDETKVIAKIKALFADRAADLIATKESPVRAALQKLSGADLKRLGVKVEADSDEVVISNPNSDVDKLVDALLKDSVEAES